MLWNVSIPMLAMNGAGRGSSPPQAITPTSLPHLLDDGYDLSACNAQAGIRTVQELLGHTEVNTTMIYTHVLNRRGRGVRSPMDGLAFGRGRPDSDYAGQPIPTTLDSEGP